MFELQSILLWDFTVAIRAVRTVTPVIAGKGGQEFKISLQGFELKYSAASAICDQSVRLAIPHLKLVMR